MIFSTLNEIQRTRSNVEVFGGYNHNLKISDGEFFDMKNLTSSYYPVLSPRDKRGIYNLPEADTHKINGITYRDSLCYVDGTSLYINDEKIEGLVLTDSKKQLISMGAYIIIMPDKKYINTKDLTDYGDIEAKFETTGTVKYEMCRMDGTPYTNVTVSASVPSEPSNMQYWIDTSTTPHTLKQYSSSNSMWTPIATTYVRISAKDIAKDFKVNDGVKISGIADSITQLKDYNNVISVLWEVYRDTENDGMDDYIVIIGMLDTVQTQTTPLKLQRLMPIMDFIIESNNRLWGCRYGLDIEGKIVNEIYASKLGDFKNWNSFAGTSNDSYAASCGTDGAWTGAINHLGYPLFFKEGYLHKVYGNFPANYQIQSTPCRGVAKGAGNSLAIINESVIYKSRNGICIYDGSLPTEISSAFGNIQYSGTEGTDELRNGATAGSHGNKYYISMKSEVDGTWNLFVFDVSIGMWHREDNTRADAFCSCLSEMYFIDHNDGLIKSIKGSGTKESTPIEWMAETGVIGSLPEKKYVSQINIRMALEVGSRVIFYIQYDSTGEWEHIASITGTTLRSFTTPIRPKRCDHFKLRIVGKGNAKIYSISKNIEIGSDL